MLNRIVLLSSLLVTSMTAHAALIQYGDYKRDSASNIVTGGGLEWLKWDVTKGMSIDSALTSYATQGWRLATNDEMASMFNRFEFGKTDWHPNESSTQDMQLPWNSGDEYSTHDLFVRLFGSTMYDRCWAYGCPSDDDPQMVSQAIYGNDTKAQGRYRIAMVKEDDTYIMSGVRLPEPHHASLSRPTIYSYEQSRNLGVALVRSYVPDSVAVPTPGSIGLLAFGLVALGYRRRQVLGR